MLRAAQPTLEIGKKRVVTGAFDLVGATADLLNSVLGGEDAFPALFGDDSYGEGEGTLGKRGFGAVAVEPGDLPGYPASNAPRNWLRVSAVINCEVFGVAGRAGLPARSAELAAGRAEGVGREGEGEARRDARRRGEGRPRREPAGAARPARPGRRRRSAATTAAGGGTAAPAAASPDGGSGPSGGSGAAAVAGGSATSRASATCPASAASAWAAGKTAPAEPAARSASSAARSAASVSAAPTARRRASSRRAC